MRTLLPTHKVWRTDVQTVREGLVRNVVGALKHTVLTYACVVTESYCLVDSLDGSSEGDVGVGGGVDTPDNSGVGSNISG